MLFLIRLGDCDSGHQVVGLQRSFLAYFFATVSAFGTVGLSMGVTSEPDMALRVSRGLSRLNMLDFIPLSEDFELVQVGPPRDFIGKTLKDLNLRAKYKVHIIAIKQLVPENFVLVPSASFRTNESDILVMLGKTDDIERIRALD